MIDARPVELAEPVPLGEDSIQIRLVDTKPTESAEVAVLVSNPAFDFLRDEPDLYE